jgi:hypothetical protein
MIRLGSIIFPALPCILVVMLVPAISPRVDRSTRWASRATPGKAVIDLAPSAIVATSSSSLASLPPRPPSRHRIKIVLEDTDARGLPPVDLGPVVMPEPVSISAASAPTVARTGALIPLRC